MLERTYLTAASFFSLQGLFGIYFGYMGMLNFWTATTSIVVSAFITWYLLRKRKPLKIENANYISILTAIFFILTLAVSLPYLVFPHGAGDFQNHARGIWDAVAGHGFSYANIDPHFSGAAAALLYYLYSNAYVILSILMILLSVFSILGVFLVGKNLYNERVGLASAVIYGFSLTSVLLLEQGFLSQVFGQFFFISSVYLFLRREKWLLLVSNIGLVSFPHYFLVYGIFLLLNFIRKRELRMFLVPAASVAAAFPETSRFFLNVGQASERFSIPFRAVLLGKGGVLTPTLFSLLVFVFSVAGLYYAWRRREWKIINILLSVAILMAVIFAAFAYAVTAGYTSDIRHLYFAGKLFYLLAFPLSILAAVGFEKTRKNKALKIVFVALLVFHSAYTITYAHYVLPQKANFPAGFYYAAEYLHSKQGEFKVGIDPGLINNIEWKSQFPYQYLIDVPDASYETGDIAKVEALRAMDFAWTGAAVINGLEVPVNSKGEEIVKYSDKDVDYYITSKELGKPIDYETGYIRVYRMR